MKNKIGKTTAVLLFIAIAAAAMIMTAGCAHSGNNNAVETTENVTKTIILYGNDNQNDLAILKKRLELFSGKGKYTLKEENDCLTLRLPLSGIHDDDYLTSCLENFLTEPGPTKVLCTRPGKESFSGAIYTAASLAPEDVTGTVVDEISPADDTSRENDSSNNGSSNNGSSNNGSSKKDSSKKDSSKLPILEDGQSETLRFTIKTRDSVSDELHKLLDSGCSLYLSNNRLYEDYDTNEYNMSGWKLNADPGNPDSFMIYYNQSDELYGNEDLLAYNLTHEELSRPYNYCILDEIEWDDPRNSISSGAFQCKEDDLGDTWYFFEAFSNKLLTVDERAQIDLVLTRRLDVLESPYAIGHSPQGGFCVKTQSERINETVFKLIFQSYSSYFIKIEIPSANCRIYPKYANIRYNRDTSAIEVTISNEDQDKILDSLETAKGQGLKADSPDMYLEADDLPLGHSVVPAQISENTFSFTDLAFSPGDSKDADYTWLAALLQDIIDSKDADSFTLYPERYSSHSPGKDIYNDPDSFSLHDRRLVSTEAAEKKIHEILPQAQVDLWENQAGLLIHMNLEPDNTLPDQIYTLIPPLLDAAALKESRYSTVVIYPCEPDGDERCWLYFSRETSYSDSDGDEGKPAISFSGYLFNGRFDAFADRILELEKEDSFFKSMIANPEYHGWNLRDF